MPFNYKGDAENTELSKTSTAYQIYMDYKENADFPRAHDFAFGNAM